MPNDAAFGFPDAAFHLLPERITMKHSSTFLLILAVVMMASVQRTPLVALGPVVSHIQQDLQISGATTGLVAALPLLLFAIFSPFAAGFARKFGMERVLISAILLLIIGLIVRVAIPSVGFLFLGTAVISAAISMSNVLLPALAKHNLPTRVGLVIYTMSITVAISSALASVIAVPLANWFNWRWSLGVWVLPAIAAFVIWLIWAKQATPAPLNPVQHASGSLNVWRVPAAWVISVLMGVQSSLFYSVINFLPSVLIEKGMTPMQAGSYTSLFQAASLFGVLLVSLKFSGSSHKQIWTTSMAGLMLAGMTGLWLLPVSQAGVWISLVGAGSSAVFSIVMMLFALRTESAHEAAALSGMAQTVGYLIAIMGPLGIGLLHDWFHSWQVSLSLLTALMFIETVLAWFASAPSTLQQTLKH